MKKRDYYEILAVDVKATPEEIKQAYRKQAIKWHPDKNPSDDAKERFQEIGEAYAVLSDPNERSWYDHHKDQILRAAESGIDENDEKYQEILTYGFDIWPYFSRDCYKEFDDAEKGFYTVYRKVFEIIKAEEEKAKNTNPDIDDDEYYGTVGGKAAPGFGDSKLSGERVVEFYAYWENFSSFKSFAHKDLYNPNEAGNRQIKRLIEKDNKKERQKEKKKYIDTIKELVQFVKKRDVRYQEFIKNEAIEKQKKADAHRKKELEKKKEMEEMKKRYREEEAERYRQEYEAKKAAGLIEDEEQYAENVYHEDWFCEICDKEFKTENQLENHKQSKAHAKKLKELMKEMMLDEEKEAFENELDAEEKDEAEEKNEDQSRKSKKKKKKNKKKNKGGDSDEEDEAQEQQETPSKAKNNKKDTKAQAKEEVESDDANSDDDDIDFAQFVPQKKQNKKQQKKKDVEPEKVVESDDVNNEDDDIDLNQFMPQTKQSKKQKKKNAKQSEPQVTTPVEEPKPEKEEEQKVPEEKEAETPTAENNLEKEDEEEEEVESGPKGKKLGKAKLKKLKKQEKAKQQNFVCNVCKTAFETRNKLFDHLKDSKHEFKAV